MLFLPLPMSVARVAVSSFAGVLLLVAIIEWRRPAMSPGWQLYALLVAFFFLNVLSMVVHAPVGWSDLEKMYGLLLIPLSIYLIRPLPERTPLYAMRGFIIGNGLLALLSLGNAINHSIVQREGRWVFDTTVWGNIPIWESIDHVGNYFFSFYFSNTMHPSYWAMYLLTCIIFIWIRNPFNNSVPVRVLMIGLAMGLIYLCASRAGVLAAAVVFFYLLYRSGSRKWIRVFAIIMVVGLFLNPRVAEVSRSIANGSYQENIRWKSWTVAVEVISTNLFLGVGFQHATDRLVEAYRANGLTEHADQELNTHNQFLETTLNSGSFTTLLLLFIFFYLFRIAWRTRNTVLSLVVTGLLIQFCFESMLNRFYGICYFVTFLIILTDVKVETDSKLEVAK